MTGSTISGTITHTVRLGRSGYTSPLTIANTGDIAPAAYGTDGIFVSRSVQGGSITNRGRISGAYGGDGAGGTTAGAGGIGVDARASISLSNAGIIDGGNGGEEGRIGFQGGIGVELAAGGSLVNNGQINGGDASYAYGARAGGVGVQIVGGKLSNTGTIAGGGGGYSSPGGIGVDLTGHGSATNAGYICGGSNGDFGYYPRRGGVGVNLDTSRMTNTGTITGGGGGGYYNGGGTGGIGANVVHGAKLTNAGTILGGNGGDGHGGLDQTAGSGGIGVSLAAATLTNTGTIRGGTPVTRITIPNMAAAPVSSSTAARWSRPA